MAVIRDNSQQTTANVCVMESDGSRRTVACASCHIRPGKGMSITLDVLSDAAVSPEHAQEVRATIAAYMAEEILKAATLGIPVAMPTAATGNKG